MENNKNEQNNLGFFEENILKNYGQNGLDFFKIVSNLPASQIFDKIITNKLKFIGFEDLSPEFILNVMQSQCGKKIRKLEDEEKKRLSNQELYIVNQYILDGDQSNLDKSTYSINIPTNVLKDEILDRPKTLIDVDIPVY